jgi:hypothetical protein
LRTLIRTTIVKRIAAKKLQATVTDQKLLLPIVVAQSTNRSTRATNAATRYHAVVRSKFLSNLLEISANGSQVKEIGILNKNAHKGCQNLIVATTIPNTRQSARPVT